MTKVVGLDGKAKEVKTMQGHREKAIKEVNRMFDDMEAKGAHTAYPILIVGYQSDNDNTAMRTMWSVDHEIPVDRLLGLLQLASMDMVGK